MKFYLSMDMEGVTALPDYTYVDSKEANYERGRRLMTGDANAIIQGAFGAGAEAMVVNDSHSKMNNLIAEDLHEDVWLIRGTNRSGCMMHGIEDGDFGSLPQPAGSQHPDIPVGDQAHQSASPGGRRNGRDRLKASGVLRQEGKRENDGH